MRILVAGVLVSGAAVCSSGYVDDAAAQSFPCSRASQAAEFAVCDDPYLAQLDERMSAIYYGLPRYVRNASYVEAERRDFLRRRNRCGYNGGCIASHYQGFIGYLLNL